MMSTADEAPRRSIDLDTVRANANLQTRRERKYVVEPALVHRFVTELPPSFAWLDIDGRMQFGYESTYFDTPGHDSYLGAATRRRRRFKVRVRRYVDSDLHMLEVKVKGQRGETVKHRREVDAGTKDGLAADQLDWIAGIVHDPSLLASLAPVVTTSYRRRTLVDTAGWSRCTIDTDLAFRDAGGRTTGLGQMAVVESKSVQPVGDVDRWFRERGHRPVDISKFCSSAAALDPTLPSHRWSRAVRRYFEPAAAV